ncbi:alanine racemase [Noviherbaspirillum denitrificans]|uniref:Alanine racemase n=1 Tax=Noviherbaspirillum denitrificans TaxID=1968433 RepID=A0A254TS34_9BURK|nr:alanine racemase [Noviherbaspirillum denitrificans]
MDLGAIRANYRFLQSKAPGARCGAAVKADAYGLGAIPVAAALAEEGCRHFFVAHLDEGIALRPHLPASAEIFVLHGPLPGTEAEFVAHGLIPVLNSAEQVAGWRDAARVLARRLPAVVQVDSGMSRLGLSPSEVDAWLADPGFLRGIDLRFLMSHLACAEQQDNPMNAAQLETFQALRRKLPQCPASFANSSGIFLGPAFHFDILRPGAALYGIAPVDGAPNPMRPVVTLQAKVIQTRVIERGDVVGYGASYRAPSRRRIATIGTGYADGWLRSLSARGFARVGSARVPIVGKVSMDTLALDVTDLAPESVLPGALVDLISAAQPVDEVAALAGTIGYEILTSLGARYHRDYVDGAPVVQARQESTEFSI